MATHIDNRGEAAGKAVQNLLATLKANPKLLVGLVGGIAIGGLALNLMGGSDSRPIVNAAMASGQSVTIENPNGGLSHITAAPGMMSASVSEEDVDQSICTARPGTHGVVEEVQVIDLLQYVKVKITDGDCAGKTGWTTRTNLKAGS